MIVLSDDLRQAIQKVATCPLELRGEATTGKDELLEMHAPYLFLYHHREPLRIYSQSAVASLRTMIDSVLDYLDNNYAQEYAKATELISQGMITLYHLEKLYHPNRLMVNGIDFYNIRAEDQSVYVLHSWPKMDNSYLHLSFWDWQFNGYRCRRQLMDRSFLFPVEDETEPFAITKLPFHPASFLSEESIELLRERGKAFWSLRRPNFVYYDDNGYGSRAYGAKPGRYMIDFEIHQRFHKEFGIDIDDRAT
jgi:hypothetical protein